MVVNNNLYHCKTNDGLTRYLIQHRNFICFQIQMPVLPNMQVPVFQNNNYQN